MKVLKLLIGVNSVLVFCLRMIIMYRIVIMIGLNGKNGD